MLQWVYRIADRVDSLAKSDPEYRELDRQRLALEEAYSRFVERLDEEDRELLLGSCFWNIWMWWGICTTARLSWPGSTASFTPTNE